MSWVRKFCRLCCPPHEDERLIAVESEVREIKQDLARLRHETGFGMTRAIDALTEGKGE